MAASSRSGRCKTSVGTYLGLDLFTECQPGQEFASTKAGKAIRPPRASMCYYGHCRHRHEMAQRLELCTKSRPVAVPALRGACQDA